jgi:predicted CxxxxCH...CXXCH cytochrome family protein
MPIDSDAMSNHFGVVPDQPTTGSRSSHTWGPTYPFNATYTYDPRAKAQEPLNTGLNSGWNGTALTNTILCVRCHNSKADTNATQDVNKPFLRVTNADNAMCLDCHRSRQTTTHTTGSHPVANRIYSSVYKLNTTAFRRTPLSPNPYNYTAKLGNYFKSGKLVCTTCHATHYADSNSATLDNRSTANGSASDDIAKGLKGQLQNSQGQLVRTDIFGATANAINVCSSCHKETKNLNHNSKGQNIQCEHCHGAHVDYLAAGPAAPNVYLVRRDFSNMSTLKVKLGANVFVYYTSTYNASSNSYASGRFKRTDGKGICQVCHTPTPGVAIHDLNDTRKDDCLSCHSHANGFAVADCASCHGQPPRASYIGGPNGKANQEYTLDESFTPHAVHADAAYYNYACKNCHYDGVKPGYHNTTPKTFSSVFVDTAGSVGTQAGFANVPGDYNSTAKNCSNVYCHSNGNPRGGSIAWKSATTPAWENGRNKIIGQSSECITCHESGSTLTTNAHYTHVTTNAIKCFVCHAATVSSATAIIDRTKHANGTKDVSFVTRPQNFVSLFNASFDNGAGTCANSCHTNGLGGSPSRTPLWTEAAINKGAAYCGSCHAAVPSSNGHTFHFVDPTGPALGTSSAICANCHTYTSGASTHANGIVDLKSSPCAPCHPNTSPTWSATSVTCESCHTGTASVVGVYTAPLKNLNATSGHGQYALANQCTACHDAASAHIGPATTKRLLIAGNGLCDSCHTTASGKGLPEARIDLPVHGGAVNRFAYYTSAASLANVVSTRSDSCAGCHDTHGTSNLSSIRTVINGQTVNYTNTSTGFRVTTPNANGIYNGLCQVCHTKTKFFTRNAPPDLGHMGGKNCLSCHTHKSATFAFEHTNGGCGGCHGYPPVRNMVGLGVSGNYSSAKFQDYSGGGGAHTVAGHIPKTASESQTMSNCSNCHNINWGTDHGVGGGTVTKANVNVIVDTKFKFNSASPITYNASTCSNVSCHFKPSPNWTTGN